MRHYIPLVSVEYSWLVLLVAWPGGTAFSRPLPPMGYEMWMFCFAIPFTPFVVRHQCILYGHQTPLSERPKSIGVCDCVREEGSVIPSIMSEWNVDLLLDNNSFDQLIEDAILNEMMGNNFNNNAYVPLVRLFPADGPPTGDQFDGPRLVLIEGSKGQRSVEEGQRAPLLPLPPAVPAFIQWLLGQL